MAGTTEKSSSNEQPGSRISELTVIEAIQKIASDNAFARIDNERHLILFLKSWWSKTYNRPLKDPLLETYTVEELLYEFYDRYFRELAAENQVNEVTDTIEAKRVQENLDWAEQEEKRELEAMRAQQTTAPKPAEEPASPLDDPANKAWMEKVMQQELELAKQALGSDFGDDINEDFE